MTTQPYSEKLLPHPSESRIVICGTARNIEHKIEKSIDTISKAFCSFADVAMIICESHSDDGTRRKLETLQSQYKNLIIVSDNSLAHAFRTVRIAAARNRLKAEVMKHFSNFHYVAMADLDGVNQDLTKRRVESCWRYQGWDVATANQPLRYYDIAALRAPNWAPGDSWQEFLTLKANLSHKKALKIAIKSKEKSISPKSNPIDVISAFGGLAIYRMSAFAQGSYHGLDKSGNETCEHVSFHQDLVNGGFKIKIIPSLVNLNRTTQVAGILRSFLTSCKSLMLQ